MTHPRMCVYVDYLLCFQGFGGKFGVQNDRMDKSALNFSENSDKTGTNYTKVKPDIGKYMTFKTRQTFEYYFIFFILSKVHVC